MSHAGATKQRIQLIDFKSEVSTESTCAPPQRFIRIGYTSRRNFVAAQCPGGSTINNGPYVPSAQMEVTDVWGTRASSTFGLLTSSKAKPYLDVCLGMPVDGASTEVTPASDTYRYI